MQKNAENMRNIRKEKTFGTVLFIVAAVVALIGIAMILLNLLLFKNQIVYQVERGQGAFWALYKEHFVSNVLLYSLNVLSLQGSVSAIATAAGVYFYKVSQK